jgi:hypothetical protein
VLSSGMWHRVVWYGFVEVSERRTTFIFNVLLAYLFGLFFDIEDGGTVFFRKVGKLLTDYTTSHLRRSYAS